MIFIVPIKAFIACVVCLCLGVGVHVRVCVCVCVCACVAIGNYRLCVYKTIYDKMPYVCVEQLKL